MVRQFSQQGPIYLMTFGKNIGCKVSVESDLPSAKILFSETGGFLVETSRDSVKKIQSIFLSYGLDVFEIGTTGGVSININKAIDLPISSAKKTWTKGLRDKL